MLEVMAQRYGTPPWEIRQAPAHDVYRHAWLLSFQRDGDMQEEAPVPFDPEQEMLNELAAGSSSLG